MATITIQVDPEQLALAQGLVKREQGDVVRQRRELVARVERHRWGTDPAVGRMEEEIAVLERAGGAWALVSHLLSEAERAQRREAVAQKREEATR